VSHRPTNKRTAVFILTIWFWLPWFLACGLLCGLAAAIEDIAAPMMRLNDWILDWLHTGCPVCDAKRSRP